MNILGRIAVGLATLVALAIVTFLAVGADRFWRIFGEPDLGPVSFEELERRSTPNDALACPPELCRARVDVPTPLYPVPARALRLAFAKAIASEPRLSVVDANDSTLTDRYVQRSERLGFPDTIVVRLLDRPDGRSTLALYSRSQLGRSDLGVNRARIERWLARLATEMRPVD